MLAVLRDGWVVELTIPGGQPHGDMGTRDRRDVLRATYTSTTDWAQSSFSLSMVSLLR